MAQWLIWGGAAATLAGIAAILWCIREVRRARSLGDGPDFKARMQRVVAVNMGALAASTIGLMLVVLGIFLQR